MNKLLVIFAGLFTFTLANVGCLIIFFKPLSDGDAVGQPWPAAVAIPIYIVASVSLHDWLSRVTASSYKAAIALGGAQTILIVDLLARGERGVVTAGAGIVMLVITWGTLAFVHARLTRSNS